MTRTEIEQRLLGTTSFDAASDTKRAPFIKAMELLQPGGVSLEYCWRFYSLGFDTSSAIYRK